MRLDPIQWFGAIRINADEINSFRLIICSDLIHPFVVRLHDRALRGKKYDDGTVLSFQVRVRLHLAARIRQREIFECRTDSKVACPSDSRVNHESEQRQDRKKNSAFT